MNKYYSLLYLPVKCQTMSRKNYEIDKHQINPKKISAKPNLEVLTRNYEIVLLKYCS